MDKIYFFSYYLKGLKGNYTVGDKGEYISIENKIINKHPLIWQKEQNEAVEIAIKKNPNDSWVIKDYKVLWWKELTDEEIQLLEL